LNFFSEKTKTSSNFLDFEQKVSGLLAKVYWQRRQIFCPIVKGKQIANAYTITTQKNIFSIF